MNNTTLSDCQNGRYSALQISDWLFIIFLVALLLLIFSSTILDLYMEDIKKTHLYRLFFAFSVYKNGKELFTIHEDNKTIKCLDGIRFLSMTWVMLGHVPYSVVWFFPFPHVYENFIRDKIAMTYMSATIACDTFLMLSGLLIVHSFLLDHEKGRKLNVASHYIKRYLRLTPCLAVIVALHTTILPYFGCGPFWPTCVAFTEGFCSKYWWATLLYIQNIANPNEICVLQSWYLTVDMQLYLISPLILYSLLKWPKRTVHILLISIVLGIILCFPLAYAYEIPVLPIVGGELGMFMVAYYTNTFVRSGPWIVGILLGIFIRKPEENKIFNQLLNNNRFTSIGWALAIIMAGVIVYAPHNVAFVKYDRLETSLYLSLHRIGWSLIVSWIIYTCITGHGGIINRFLSWNVFRILSKLTYCTYIVNLTFQIVRIGLAKSIPEINNFNNIHNYCGDLVISIFFAIILTLAVEMPVQNLVKLFTVNDKKNK